MTYRQKEFKKSIINKKQNKTQKKHEIYLRLGDGLVASACPHGARGIHGKHSSPSVI